ncbi:hypothetical protein EPI10_026565 [Gossypium australe]|uniref:Uncharacterized protein n=1 Tax=Gossypium australe TaxID=47621 RepID=A0A5B6UP15_9ROSI|nr:hypothetical protein EPI10_026565 [Gossypium australe]
MILQLHDPMFQNLHRKRILITEILTSGPTKLTTTKYTTHKSKFRNNFNGLMHIQTKVSLQNLHPSSFVIEET